MWLAALRRKRAAAVGSVALPYVSKGSRVVGIGCGHGYVAEYLNNKGGGEVVGVEIVNKLETATPFFLYDGETLPFKDKEFSLGLLIFVLHHARDEFHLLAEAQRVAERILVVEDVYSTIWGYLFTVVLDFMLNCGKGSVRFRRVQEWERIFSERGLSVLDEREFTLGKFGPTTHCLFLLRSSSEE